jgi:hypothetical protein
MTGKQQKHLKKKAKKYIFVTIWFMCSKFRHFGLVLTIFDVILANLVMNPLKHNGRIL